VIGAGSFGANHVRVVGDSPRAELKYVVDSDGERAREQAEQRGAEAATDYREVIGKVDAAIVAVPTIAHAEVACALLDAGIAVNYACAEGVCGTCETRVIEGTPDHRDLFLSKDEQAANKTMMICRSRAKSSTLVLDL